MVVKEKILVNVPVLYSELIYDNLNEVCRSRNEFIIQAIEEKFEREKINYKPKIDFTPQTQEQIEDVEYFLKKKVKR